MSGDGTTAVVVAYPPCDLCQIEGGDNPAWADAVIRVNGRSTWAYVCHTHFTRHGGSLGTGRGQQLVLAR